MDGIVDSTDPLLPPIFVRSRSRFQLDSPPSSQIGARSVFFSSPALDCLNMVTNQHEQTFTYDRSNQLVYCNLRGLENFSPFSSNEKNSQSVSDYVRYHSFVYTEEELKLDSLKKENDKRPLADVSPSQVDNKRPKQDSYSDEVACNGPSDSSCFNLDSAIWVPTFRDDPFHKPVNIGLNHQANIPSWNDKHVGFDNDSDKWVADCVILEPNSKFVQNRNIECDCIDEGSIRCVRKHIYEARENRRNELGQENFEKLGFCDMGEEVALKWGEDEERLFEQVVLFNPKSVENNFWEELSNVFPNKSRRELVSYYFNVFILRKRAEQNRYDPIHIDSDDDYVEEWEEIQNEPQMEDEEEEEE
ncbi:hypothetical protein LUZ60_006491 [Juncus effusus]|nr:hypothetical protein LUZ60_006491 [Juncus effusus]